jgi:hypothetical protein
LQLGFEVCGVLDGADSYVGASAVFVLAEACDPDFAVAEHDALGVDEEGFVPLLQDDRGDVRGDDPVVVLDEGLWRFDGYGTLARVHFDGVVNEGGDDGGVVLSDGSLEVGEELLNFDVASDGEIDGFIEIGGGSLRDSAGRQEKQAGDQDQLCEFGAEVHSVSPWKMFEISLDSVRR